MQAQTNQCNCTSSSFVTLQDFQNLKDNLDAFFLVINGVIVWLMACGFAMLEVGAIRAKNAVNVIIRNLLDQTFGILGYWLCGFAFANGDGNAFIGTNYFALDGLDRRRYALWFFHWTFASTAPSIVSGAVSERITIVASIVQSVILTNFTYAVVTHWIWHPQGWLMRGLTVTIGGSPMQISFQDFAGSAVVHLTGGASALIAAVLIKPRIDRLDCNKKLKPAPPGHSIPIMTLGAMILIFGFLAFNGGSNLTISNAEDGAKVSHAVASTSISFASAALGGFVATKIFFDRSTWQCSRVINAALTGQVATCASCNSVAPWGAFCVGFFAAFIYTMYAKLTPKLGIDDPLEAIAVHFGGGSWGCIAAALFNVNNGVFYYFDQRSGYVLLWQFVGVLAVSAWSIVISGMAFLALHFCRILRPPAELEIKGLDQPIHGEESYAAVAYENGWTAINCTYIPGDSEASQVSQQLYQQQHQSNGNQLNVNNNHPELASLNLRDRSAQLNKTTTADETMPTIPTIYSQTTNF